MEETLGTLDFVENTIDKKEIIKITKNLKKGGE